ncbi:Synaptotagmin-13 [Tupaia chinensis]|uniref:Synaptotagmin-13 n=1 Tax=Tupaia chinensis TaxID=246437 RepID=L9JI86_TUPCH|nr:Synaptotagmin-13 [Tupaia chinensis]
MVLSVPVIALGATLGTATSILALCGVTCLCRHMHPKKGQLPRDQDPDPEKARTGVLRPAQQFNVKKSTEPVQPRALLKFPDIYGPRPAVTAPEVINYADYTLRATEEPAAPASPQAPSDSRLKRQVTEELFILPQNVSFISIDFQKAAPWPWALGQMQSGPSLIQGSASSLGRQKQSPGTDSSGRGLRVWLAWEAVDAEAAQGALTLSPLRAHVLVWTHLDPTLAIRQVSLLTLAQNQ